MCNICNNFCYFRKQEHESIEHYCIEMGEQKQVDDISNSNQEDIEEQEMDAVLDDNGIANFQELRHLL